MTIVLDDDLQAVACEIDPRSIERFLEYCTQYTPVSYTHLTLPTKRIV